MSLNQLTSSFTWLKNLANSFQLITQNVRKFSTGLFWQTGAAPFLGGGFGHFFHYAPEKIEYAVNRFAMEAKRQLDLLDKELANKPYISGDEYTIADIAIWSWYGRLAQDKIWDKAGIFLDVKEYKHLQAWTEKIANRPAVKRGLEVEYKEI
ncbi:hypothetical protein STHE1630_00581 [Streptococcus thermophilus CNCM I-1630]|nr:hypothetical protein STHE1630_00581 [Streptococcus thermophilus CNCM I-1630]